MPMRHVRRHDGRRRVQRPSPGLLIGYAVFGVANLRAVGGSVGVVVTLRAVAGVGAALLMPASLAAVSEVYDDETRSQAIAIWASLAAAGGALGPFLGGVLVTAGDWPAVFAGNAFLAGIGLVGTVVWVAELPGRRFDRFDRLGAVLSVTAVACLVFLVIEGPRHPLAGTTLLALIGTVGLTVVFLRHEARTDDPLLPLHLFRDRDRIAGSGTLLLAALGFNGIFFVGALQLQLGWGESGLVTGLLLAPIGVVEVIVANLAVAIARRWGVQNTVTMGLCLMAAGYVGMGLAPAGDRSWFVAAGVVAGLGNGLTIPLSVDRIMGSVEPEFAGSAAGVNDMAIELGASAGIGLWAPCRRSGSRPVARRIRHPRSPTSSTSSIVPPSGAPRRQRSWSRPALRRSPSRSPG